MHLSFLISLFAILNVAQSIDFINPGPSGDDSEYALNPSYPYGSNLNIQWSPTNRVISLVMYQQTQNAEFEYIFQNKRGLSSYSWDITTTKSLDVSRIFFLEIFIRGQTAPAAFSHYFNVTGGPESAVASSSSATPTSSLSSATTYQPTSPTTGLTAPASVTSAASSPSPDEGGLSTGAKVGLGVAIPVAVIAGLLAGWWFFARKRKSNKPSETQHAQSEPVRYDQSQPGWHDQSQPVMQEYYKPVEMQSHQDAMPYYKPLQPQSHELDSIRNPAELAGDNHGK
ncbi:hypothetical protein LTR37_002320 [Vermiconidia calcicola]|uniref:Uncharacterized protein n=1 Tax=Vermiconidia calcicola TaxID=1690605 RepID=A0ACC3NTK9_9PEZI|nr:hypothetical protein LTR37_002320 [Vermiconidia calcicola]